MKPRTRIQKRVEELRHKLPALSAKQKKHIRSLTVPIGKHLRASLYCLECGHVHRGFTDCAVKTHKCEGCKETLTIDRERGVNRQEDDMNIITTCGEFQVLRLFEVVKISARKSKPHYWETECFQIWIRKDYKTVFVHGYSFGAYGTYTATNNNFSIKPTNLSLLRRYSWEIYPEQKWHDWFLERLPNGMNLVTLSKSFEVHHSIKKSMLTFTRLFYYYGADYFAEVLLKTNQISAFQYLGWSYDIEPYKPIIAICNRHKFIIKDFDLWRDMIRMMNDLGMDIRNPKYICPDDLKEMHDFVSEKMKAKRLKDESEKEKEEIRIYHKRMAKYREFVLKDKTLEIRPLLTIKDVYNEGEKMKHCIYSNGYYSRKNYALFTSSVKGEPAESIVIDESTLSIREARGYKNEETRYHNRIIKTINSHKDLFINTINQFQP